jgi:hypothetical protein
MAGEIQLNSTTMATESSGSITAELDTIRPNTTNGSLTLQGDNSDAGVTGLTIDSSGVVNTTTAKVTNIQATSGQSLTIKDEDGNAAITIGTDNTAAGYLSLNFGSYHGDSAGAGSGTRTDNTLSDYEQGSWSPNVVNSGSSSTFTSKTGRYTKIGRFVYATFVCDSGNSGTGGTGLNLTGLPFAYAGTSNVPTLVAFTGNNLSNNDAIVSRTSNSATSFLICKISGGTAVTDSVGFAAGTVIYEV